MFTAPGRARFDEMDGIYPMLAGIIAILLLIAAVILWFVFQPPK